MTKANIRKKTKGGVDQGNDTGNTSKIELVLSTVKIVKAIMIVRLGQSPLHTKKDLQILVKKVIKMTSLTSPNINTH